VHLLILLGPSLFGPRSRILLTIDGLKVQAWNSGTQGGTFADHDDENQCSGRNTGSELNRVHRLGQVCPPLSSVPPPTTNVLDGNNIASGERTENRAPLDSINSDPSTSGEPLVDYLGEQQALSAAERLLSRSLTMACAEDGVTLNAELGTDLPLTTKPKL
jgi:hypothetical protein